jgi:hypothetical protein
MSEGGFWFFIFLAVVLPGMIMVNVGDKETRLMFAGIYFIACYLVAKFADSENSFLWALGTTIAMILVGGTLGKAIRRGNSGLGECIDVGRFGEFVCY